MTNDRVGWFEALGRPIPEEQREAAIREAREMGVDASDDSPWVDEVADLVEADCPEEAIEETRVHLDYTGTFRFLAALCTPVDRVEIHTDGGRSENRTERTVSQIHELSASVENPDRWRVLVPVDYFGAVKERLDTVDDVGAYFNGISLCYTDHHDEPRVEYSADLSDHLGSGEADTGDGEEIVTDGGQSANPPQGDLTDTPFSDGEVRDLIRGAELLRYAQGTGKHEGNVMAVFETPEGRGIGVTFREPASTYPEELVGETVAEERPFVVGSGVTHGKAFILFEDCDRATEKITIKNTRALGIHEVELDQDGDGDE